MHVIFFCYCGKAFDRTEKKVLYHVVGQIRKLYYVVKKNSRGVEFIGSKECYSDHLTDLAREPFTIIWLI